MYSILEYWLCIWYKVTVASYKYSFLPTNYLTDYTFLLTQTDRSHSSSDFYFYYNSSCCSETSNLNNTPVHLLQQLPPSCQTCYIFLRKFCKKYCSILTFQFCNPLPRFPHYSSFLHRLT